MAPASAKTHTARTHTGPAMLAHLAAALLLALPSAAHERSVPTEGAAHGEAAPAVTEEDAALERLRAHLVDEAAASRQTRVVVGTVVIGAGVGLATLALVGPRYHEEEREPFLASMLVGSGAVVATGVLQLALTSPAERAVSELDGMQGSSTERRSRFEGRMQRDAQDGRRFRHVFGGIAAGLGLLGLGAGVALGLDARSSEPAPTGNALWMAGAGAAATVAGLGLALVGSTPAERSWERYQADPAVKSRGGPALQLGAGPVGRSGVGLALAGRF